MRDSMVIYRSQIDALRALPGDQFKAAVLAIADYAMDDLTPDGDPVALMAFGMAKPLIDKNNKRYENGKRGGRPTNQTEPNNNQTETKPKPNNNQTEPNPNLNVKCKMLNVKKEISPKGDTKKSPPTLEEVRAYIKERGSDVDAEHFFDYYASQKWKKANGQPVSDWKACVRTWERNQRPGKTAEGARPGKTASASKFSTFPQREYEFNSLEAALLNAQRGTV